MLSNGHLVFNFEIFPYEAIANQSNKVGISQIQQQPKKPNVKIDFFFQKALVNGFDFHLHIVEDKKIFPYLM